MLGGGGGMPSRRPSESEGVLGCGGGWGVVVMDQRRWSAMAEEGIGADERRCCFRAAKGLDMAADARAPKPTPPRPTDDMPPTHIQPTARPLPKVPKAWPSTS